MTLTTYFLIALITSLIVYATLYFLDKNNEFDLNDYENHIAIAIGGLFWIILAPLTVLIYTTILTHKLVSKWKAK